MLFIFFLKMQFTRRSLVAILIGTLMLLNGCAAPKPPATFYPPEPDLPRVQYLMSIVKPADLKLSKSTLDIIGGEELGLFTKPYGIAFHKNQLYVVDNGLPGYIVIDFATKKATAIRRDKNNPLSEFESPFNIAIDGNGNKYISDLKRKGVLVYSADDRYLRTYSFGEESKPLGVAVQNNELLVSDINGGSITAIDISSDERRQLINGTSKELVEAKAQLFWPTMLTIGPDQSLYVTDTGNFNLVQLSKDGKFLRKMGTVGDSPGFFARPKGTAVDRNKVLYVVDSAFGNAQLFNDEGVILMPVAQSGDRPQDLLLPVDIDISYDLVSHFQQFAAEGFKLEYIFAVSSQAPPGKVNIYGFGKMVGRDYSAYTK